MTTRLRFLGLAATAVGATFALAAAAPTSDPIDGYSPAASAKERAWEEKFRALPSPAELRASMERLSARPHHVGSPYDRDNAEWILARFRTFGLDAHIETFEVLMPTPKDRVLEMLEPRHVVAKLAESPLPQDPTSGQQSEQLPTYNAFSADGDVTAPLVYVNYGIPKDYEELERLGVSVKGAIVIARYGHSWRGIKPKVAAEHGAIGCIIYSDPADDGFTGGDAFPAGPFRPEDGVQRGAVTDTLYEGDPLTPGVGATKNAKRIALKDCPLFTKIPTLPISWGDAQPLLAALSGEVVPEAWRGALPLTYRTGPGPAKVHLRMESNWDMKTIYDVIARIPGGADADEWVIRGNHHDAWVNGADDPISGQVALLEEARSFGELLKQGWRPRRTMFLCAWDGEEEGLFGSTEWAETHAEELAKHAVAYFNSDNTSRGFLSFRGSHTLERFINDVARDVTDPEKGISVWKREQLHRISRAASQKDRDELRSRHDLKLRALGDGSDYAAFLDHFGIAAADFRFGGEDDGGVYHSIYDDFYWYTHFSDTEFVYGRALAQTVGTAEMRLADAEILPFDFAALSDAVRGYTSELHDLLKDERDESAERARQLDEGLFDAVADPRHRLAAPPRQDTPPFLNLAPLDNGDATLAAASGRFAKAMADFRAARKPLPDASRRDLNSLLRRSERQLTDDAGLPRRPWFRHLLYAPGAYTGYAVKTIPGVREGIELRKWDEAEREAVRVGKALSDEAALVDRATKILQSGAEEPGL